MGGVGPMTPSDFDGVVFGGLEIDEDGAIGLRGNALVDGMLEPFCGLQDIILMTEDVSEPVWRGNGEVVLGGLGEEPAAEMFGIDGRGGSIGEADVGLAVGGKKECGRSADGEELLEWRGFVGFLAQLFHECTFWHESTALGEAARRD